jgi:hypothetical protein
MLAGVLVPQSGVAYLALIQISIIQGWKKLLREYLGSIPTAGHSEYGHARMLRGACGTV